MFQTCCGDVNFYYILVYILKLVKSIDVNIFNIYIESLGLIQRDRFLRHFANNFVCCYTRFSTIVFMDERAVALNYNTQNKSMEAIRIVIAALCFFYHDLDLTDKTSTSHCLDAIIPYLRNK